EASVLIRELDEETQQVEIEARLVDMDRAATRRLGVTWNAENLGDAGEGFSAAGAVNQPIATASGDLRLGLIRSWGNLDATLEAFEQENQAHIISNPKIMTVNNHPAEILVGREIPLITLDEAGNPVTELKKVGIALRCTPYINSDGKITMDLHPEISDLSSQATVQGGLIFTTSEALTRIMVEDGQTAVIGGLVRTNETEFEQGVPILREIPILGGLFKSSDKVTEERELLIFVTPRIVRHMASN
ncbi:MAG: type II and III secretion system protein, partial [Candidatus Eisenbacteria bacterium]|nr:type II and III secretion system protein [Candidatus Eisenbacteria bacterium]